MRFRRASTATVITEAQESPQAQLRRRQRTYIAMMSLRAVCLLGATLVVGLEVPHALAWVGVFIVGMVLLPWMAVLIANDRPPRKASRFTSKLRRDGPPENALPSTGSTIVEH